MQVNTEILTEWTKNLDKGDQKSISETLGVSEQTISKAFNGEASEETINGITQFFIRKQERIAGNLEQLKVNQFLSDRKA